MKWIIKREALIKPLQQVCSVIERRQTLPILSNLLLRAGKGQSSMIGTDLELEVICPLSFEEVDEDGEVTLPARKFLDICRALPEQAMIELSQTKGKEQVTVRSGKSRFALSVLPASGFPNMETMQKALAFKLPQVQLKNAITKTQFAMAQQDVRYYLNGMMLELGTDEINLVATDGHRLAMCTTPVENKETEQRQVIIPRKGVIEIGRVLSDTGGDVEVRLGSNHIQFDTGESQITSKLIDGRFPDYRVVMPKCDKTLTADTEQLRQALVRTSVLANEKYRSVRLQLSSGSMRLHTHNPEHEEAEEDVVVEYNGQDLEIGFNATYLLDAITATGGERVQIEVSDSNSSCLIRGVGKENCKYVVMPMRL
jgi:DNA polymerase III subunit beta